MYQLIRISRIDWYAITGVLSHSRLDEEIVKAIMELQDELLQSPNPLAYYENMNCLEYLRAVEHAHDAILTAVPGIFHIYALSFFILLCFFFSLSLLDYFYLL
jgi:hypothetical protein